MRMEVIDYEDLVKLNSFQEICEVADKENWCWNICCGTCGHSHFVKSLALLINCRPLTPIIDRITKIPKYHYMKDKLLNEFSHNVQNKVKDVSIDYFANNFQYPSFLGYLGIGLYYSENAEKENRVLTKKWIPPLISLMDADKGHTYLRKNWETGVWESYTSKYSSTEVLQAILDNGEVLTWKDLAHVERASRHLRPSGFRW